MSDEKDDLESLLKSPGWLRFRDAQVSQWQDQITDAMASAANDRDDLMALHKIRQVLAAQRAILTALSWPSERLQRLKASESQPVSLSRGGYQ